MINLEDKYLLDIVTVTHNSGSYIRCHRDLIRKNTGVNYRHHIVDNGSTDDSADYATIRNIYNVGYPLACNQGAASGTGELICFMNPDVFVPAFWHKEMVDLLIYKDYAAAGPRSLFLDGSKQIEREEMLIGNCFMVRRDVFERVGGLNPLYYFCGDDDEFFPRLTKLGWKWKRTGNFVVHVGGEAINVKSVYAKGGSRHARYHLKKSKEEEKQE